MNHSGHGPVWIPPPGTAATNDNRRTEPGRAPRPPWLAWAERHSPEFAALLRRQSGVLDVRSALGFLSPGTLRCRLDSGRWQRPCRGVVVAHSGPLSARQALWVAVLWAGPDALLAGLTAAQAEGLTGFTDQRIHLLLPAARQVRKQPAGLRVMVHRSCVLGPADIHPLRLPPRTRLPRSLIDAAAWMATGDSARAVLAAGVQQRLVRPEDLVTVAQRSARLKRRALIVSALADIAGGAHALSELDFSRLVRRYDLPEPDRQAMRRDAQGWRRWLDALWESAKLVVEVDGCWHMDANTWWEDMRRDNHLTVSGYRVLRFPAFAVRYPPDEVAQQISEALRLGARRAEAPGRGPAARWAADDGLLAGSRDAGKLAQP